MLDYCNNKGEYIVTAIVLVWNRAGLAIAADQSVSTTRTDEKGNKQTLWTESSSKLFSFEGHKVIAATSGNAAVNSIPIASILNRWSREITEEFETLAEYVHNFLDWLGQQKLNDHYSTGYSTSVRILIVLNTIKEDLDSMQDFESASTLEKIDVINASFDNWESDEYPNLFSYGISKYLRLSFDDIENPSPGNMKIAEFLRERSRRELSQIKTTEEFQFLKEIFDVKFTECFGELYNSNLEWHLCLRDRLLLYISNFIDSGEDSNATILFTGYGKGEWIPNCVIVRIFHYDTPLPKASVVKISDPEQTWFESIAKDAEIYSFLNGISSQYKTGVFEYLESDSWEMENDSESMDSLRSLLSDLSDTRIEQMRKKIDLLSLDKLEFIARQFVQVESLASFLLENLPSVGGNIDTITMSR